MYSHKSALTSQFNKSLYWNLLDSVGSQALLVGHHIALRMYMGNEFHGFFSLVISLFYVLIMIANSGFDNSIASVWSYFSSSKNRFRAFLKAYWIPQLFFIFIFCLLLHITYLEIIKIPFLEKFIPLIKQIPPSLELVILGTFITESLKKTIKYFLQLSFYNTLTALVEFLGMISYIASIWIVFFLQQNITQFSCFLNLFIISSIQLSILLGGLVYYYMQLPQELLPATYHLIQTLKNRFFIFCNQLINQIFSSNALVPICAFVLGLEIVSFIKIVTSITQWIILVAQKTLGVSTIALLSQTKTNIAPIRKKMFLYSNAVLQQVLYAMGIFLAINGQKIVHMHIQSSTILSLDILYFLLSMSFIESFFIVYEKWFIVEEKTYLFFALNSICLFILYAVGHSALQCYSQLSLTLLVALLVAIRMLGFVLLTICIYYIWNIKPTLSLQPKTLIIGLTASLIFMLVCS